MEKLWYDVKVFDAVSHSTTTIGMYGTLESIKEELIEDNLWQFVSAVVSKEQ